jgi:subfamily B ATP-binding cassette protein HlyB/CyaB
MNMNVNLDTDAMTSFKPEGSGEPTGLGCLVIVARHHGFHLSVSQLIHDNVLTGGEVSVAQLVKCAQAAGLSAKRVNLNWSGLSHLKKALPAIVTLKNGGSMVLRQLVDIKDVTARVLLQDPNAEEDAVLAIDRVRFEEVWTGEVVLVKRDYEVSDESQPFGKGLIGAVIFHDRWVVRDVAISALVLGLLALAPIVFWRLLMDRVIYYKAFNTFYVLCAFMLVMLAFETIFTYLRHFLVVYLTTRVDLKLSIYVFDKILNLPMDFFERTHVGEITHKLADLAKIRIFLTGSLFGSILDSTVLLFFLPVMFFFSGYMTLVVLTFVAIIVLWLLLMLPVLRRKSRVVVWAEQQRGAFLVQSIHGIRTIKSLALDARQRHMWDVHVARVAKARHALGQTSALIATLVTPLEQVAVSGSFALGVYLALSTNDPVYLGALFAFLMLSRRVVSPLVQMARLINEYDEARSTIEVIGHLVNQPAEEGRSGHGVRRPLEGHVQFSNVTFKYQGAPAPALADVSFEVPFGTTLGIMGRSGSGKTTITRLLQRLHSNYEGLIKIDGIDVREYDVDHLRRGIGVVLQENFLFSGTIRENITAAKTDATFDEVVRAARMAGAEEFIDRLPRGYETYIYEGSPNLSGGQRQRLAIARALMVDPRILLLDEATSALDADSEAIVNANISRMAHGRSMIIISHRLSSLVTADAILVLERGRVIDLGKHQELLARCDIYSDLWSQQTRHMTGPASGRDKPAFRNPSRVS